MSTERAYFQCASSIALCLLVLSACTRTSSLVGAWKVTAFHAASRTTEPEANAGLILANVFSNNSTISFTTDSLEVSDPSGKVYSKGHWTLRNDSILLLSREPSEFDTATIQWRPKSDLDVKFRDAVVSLTRIR